MTLEELFSGKINHVPLNKDETATRTYETTAISSRHIANTRIDANALIRNLKQFNETYKDLREKDRESLYNEFYIPKKSGGLRKIDAPNNELKRALYDLKNMFEEDFASDGRTALYHTSAFAYIKHRSTIEAVKRHQSNESRWFAKYDLSNFFGSTTPDFMLNMLSMIFPFCLITENEEGKKELSEALELCFLNGGLPQGTPISPLLTNVMMIPIDYRLSNSLRSFEDTKFVYTRYADDFLVSSKYNFDFRKIEKYITDILSEFNAPFTIKSQKTRYGSSAGSNWNLGIMLNKDNKLSIGHKKKKQFIAMISSYVMDKINGRNWDKNDVQVLEGYRNYYRMIEKDNIDKLIEHIGEKFKLNIISLIKADLAA